ncbi:5-formyltetrahydrofolate cyclo-ligase [Paenibacillus koleovorans]|uniref:5-formyltetrahydrofolate cyclo-ligase n=1 Tax=Paenibacillus koleovorans TaxID=121608 RepID=UPI0013E32750|nr:5-formyltetrahydrofolate cyclo-ligase [Paenibacillus koleovorans]
MQDHKKQLRRRLEAERTALAPEQRAAKSEAICRMAIDRVLEPLLLRRVSAGESPVLFAYVPLQAEVDVGPILRWGWDKGVPVAVPKVIAAGKQLQLHLILGYDDLEPGAYGILEPGLHAPVLVDLTRLEVMLVPGLAFDASMGRMGYGGGFYDRFIERCRTERGGDEPFKLALAYDLQVVPEVPMDAHDMRVDAVVTESKLLSTKL